MLQDEYFLYHRISSITYHSAHKFSPSCLVPCRNSRGRRQHVPMFQISHYAPVILAMQPFSRSTQLCSTGLHNASCAGIWIMHAKTNVCRSKGGSSTIMNTWMTLRQAKDATNKIAGNDAIKAKVITTWSLCNQKGLSKTEILNK